MQLSSNYNVGLSFCLLQLLIRYSVSSVSIKSFLRILELYTLLLRVGRSWLLYLRYEICLLGHGFMHETNQPDVVNIQYNNVFFPLVIHPGFLLNFQNYHVCQHIIDEPHYIHIRFIYTSVFSLLSLSRRISYSRTAITFHFHNV